MATKYTVAAQMFGFRDFVKTPEDLLSTLKRIKKMGYDGVQVSGCALDAATIRAACDKAGLPAIGTHVAIPKFRENEKAVIEYCKTLGISYVAIPWLDATQQKTLADWKKLFREFEGYAKRFAKAGLHVQYHNHDFEFQQFGVKGGKGGKALLDMLYDGTTALQAELDLGWVARGGCNPENWVKKVAGRMDQVHFKDWSIWRHEDGHCGPEFRAIGEGSLDWASLIKVCKKSGVKTFIVEQDNWIATGDPFVEYAISRKNLKALGL